MNPKNKRTFKEPVPFSFSQSVISYLYSLYRAQYAWKISHKSNSIIIRFSKKCKLKIPSLRKTLHQQTTHAINKSKNKYKSLELKKKRKD